MASDSDKKLVTLISNWLLVKDPGAVTQELCEQIKAAFIDAGWLAPLNGVPFAEADRMTITNNRMTGQEWYASLEDLSECNCESHINQVCDKCQIIRPFLAAAKKAVGIE